MNKQILTLATLFLFLNAQAGDSFEAYLALAEKYENISARKSRTSQLKQAATNKENKVQPRRHAVIKRLNSNRR